MRSSIHMNKTLRRWIISAAIAITIALFIALAAYAELKNVPLSWGPTGTGHTWVYIDNYQNEIADADTATSSTNYWQTVNLRSWYATDYIHLGDEKYNGVMNGTYTQAPGGVLVAYGWVTTQHYWQGAPGPTNLRVWAYTSGFGKTSTSACWDGSNCPPPWR